MTRLLVRRWGLGLLLTGCGAALSAEHVTPAVVAPPAPEVQMAPLGEPVVSVSPTQRCLALAIASDTRIEINGRSTFGQYPDVRDWPEQVVALVREAYCQGGPLYGEPRPVAVEVIELHLEWWHEHKILLRVDEDDSPWPIGLVVTHKPNEPWRLEEASIERAKARNRMMRVARWLGANPGVEALSATSLTGDWWRARVRDATGSTICVFRDRDDTTRCYRENWPIEHFGNLATEFPHARERSRGHDGDEMDTDPGSPLFTLALWPGRDSQGRTTEVWRFDAATLAACRAKPTHVAEPKAPPGAFHDWRDPRATSMRVEEQSEAPVISAGACEPLTVEPTPDWVAMVRGIDVSVERSEQGPARLSMSMYIADGADEGDESVLCIREAGWLCGVASQLTGAMHSGIESVLARVDGVGATWSETLKRQVAAGSVYAVQHSVMGRNFADVTERDSASLSFLTRVDGLWIEETPTLGLGHRERMRTPTGDGQHFWATRRYYRPTLCEHNHVLLERVVADTMELTDGRLTRRTVDTTAPARRCVYYSHEDGWADTSLDACKPAVAAPTQQRLPRIACDATAEPRVLNALMAELDRALAGSHAGRDVDRLLHAVPACFSDTADTFAKYAGCRLAQVRWATLPDWIDGVMRRAPLGSGQRTHFDVHTYVLEVLTDPQPLELGVTLEQAREYLMQPSFCTAMTQSHRQITPPP